MDRCQLKNSLNIDWRIWHDMIAESASYVLNEDPKLQVSTLRETLKQAETEGVDRRDIYDFTYDD